MNECDEVNMWSGGAARLGRQKTAHGFLWRAVGTEVRNA